ncbi:imidazolonepropionase-like domain-containing protein [Streptomyces sp. NPDC051567]|uniref:imidazolonepropionase-like domain-containing protein n=1 Tax=Streptomyces sp. NPDC051567 TaxID=3365660 RepID=UPI0037BA1117
MLTLHTAEFLVPGPGAAPLAGGAVLVEGDRIARVGPYEELGAAWPQARTRRWPGVLTPGLLVHGADVLLERTYYPDDRESAELGTAPITGRAALEVLGTAEARWGHSARRGTQKLLARGVVAVTGRFTVPAVRTALSRSGLTVLPPPDGLPGLPGLPGPSGPPDLSGPAGHAFHGVLEPGAPARFAVFAVADPAEFTARSADTCVATVIGGRLLHRRR